MTGEKKKKKRLNRSILLAKKIIIKDGGTVSDGKAKHNWWFGKCGDRNDSNTLLGDRNTWRALVICI